MRLVSVVISESDLDTIVESLDEEIDALESLTGRGNDIGNKKELLQRIKLAKNNLLNSRHNFKLE